MVALKKALFLTPEKIRWNRRYYGLTRKKLAKELNVCYIHLSNVERGKYHVSEQLEDIFEKWLREQKAKGRKPILSTKDPYFDRRIK